MFLRIIRNILISIGTFILFVAAVIIAIVVSDYYGIPERLSTWWAGIECYISGVALSPEFRGLAPVVAIVTLIIVGLLVIRLALSMLKKES